MADIVHHEGNGASPTKEMYIAVSSNADPASLLYCQRSNDSDFAAALVMVRGVQFNGLQLIQSAGGSLITWSGSRLAI